MNDYLYLITMVFGNTENVAFIGLARSFKGGVNVLRKVYPDTSDLEIVSQSPTGDVLCQKKGTRVFVHFSKDRRPALTEVDTAWVVCKRNEGKMTERVWALFNSDKAAKEFIERNVDEPKWLYRYECEVYEIDGYKKFSKIIGDTNPELNRVHYSIYKTVIEE